MIIGVDVDGVLTNLDYFFKKNYKKFSKENNIKIKRKKADNLSDYFGWTKEQDLKFWDENIWKYSESVKFYKTASKYLKKLHNDGHEIYIITRRHYMERQDDWGERMRAIVDKQFKENDIVYDKFFAVGIGNSKFNVIKDNNVEIMIDDESGNLKEISKLIPTICYTQNYNVKLKLDNMHHCKNWREIYNYIRKLNKN